MITRITLMIFAALAAVASFAQPAGLTFTPWPDRSLTLGNTEGDFLGTKNSLLTGVNAANYDEAHMGLVCTHLVNVDDPDDQLAMALACVYPSLGEDNDLNISNLILVDGEELEHTEQLSLDGSDDYGNRPISTIAGEWEYIYIDNYGTAEDFAKVKDVLAGRIAVCNRGTIPFVEKANAAVANGAIAVIVVNNQGGTINMSLTGYEYDKPAICASMAGGELLKSKASYVDGDAPYYQGTLTISGEKVYEHQTSSFGIGEEEYYPDFDVRAKVIDPEKATPGATYQATITYLGGYYYEYLGDDYKEWPIEMSELTDKTTTTLTLVVPSATVTGDVNGDGSVNATDLSIVVNIIAGLDSKDNYDGRADVNADADVNATDIAAIVNIIAGLE